jgi:putative Holliday junction resolvase
LYTFAVLPYTETMRYLGIDYGAKRVGIALSDENMTLAFPLEVLDNSDELITELEEICKKNNVTKIVVGDSRDFFQKENNIMKEIKPFVEKIQKVLGVPVEMHPEFLTSMEAERIQGHNDMHDASAAALILKSFLETHKNNLKNNT